MPDQLIQRWLNHGDERAAEALYDMHHARIYRLAYALLGDAQDAEEVMQDTMVYALTHTDLYDARKAAFTTWLHTITVSRCRDRKRRKRLPRIPLTSGTDGNSQVADGNRGPEATAILHEDRTELWQALQELSPKLREAVVLRYWSGHPYHEIAQILHCPLPTAQSRVRLAYEQLRKLLSPTGVPALRGENLR